MKFLAALIVFIIALAAGASFFGALALSALAVGVVFFFQKMNASSTVDDSRPQDSDTTPQAQTIQTGDYIPDVRDPELLREYLIGLAERVRGLESEIALLRGKSAAPQWLEPVGEPIPAETPATAEAPPEEIKVELPVMPEIAPVPEPLPDLRPDGLPALARLSEQLREAPQAQEPTRFDASPVSVESAAVDTGTPTQPLAPEIPATEPEVIEPSGPSLLSRLLSGNIVAKVGAIILFFGVGFLLKFAYDHSMFPPEARLAGVAISAVAVFIFGWKLKDTRRLYGLILQGVASGLAYLTVFFALKTYGFIGVPAGFVLFAILGVATTLLAVRQEAKPLAVLGLTGAFMAPILASTGQGNHVFLFSYYLLLNVFILAVSWFRSWRELNLTGWIFTFAIAAVWGSRSYTAAMFGTVEPFLLAYFAMYLVIPILFATRQPPQFKGLVDGTLVFGTPAAVAMMQARLVWDMPDGLAWSSALGAALYAVLAFMVLRRENMRLLGLTYVALALGLGTLAIAFAFGAYLTFALWTIEGTAILWVCLRQKSLPGRLFAIFVQGAGAVEFFLDYDSYARVNPWFNDAILGCAIIAVASFISAALCRRHAANMTQWEKGLAGLLLVWGASIYALGGLDAIHHGVGNVALQPAIAILFLSASAVIADLLGARTGWTTLRGLTVAHPPFLVGAALLQYARSTQPLADLGWLAWPLGLGSLFWMLHRQRRDGFDAALEARYAGAWLILGAVATWQTLWYLQHDEYLFAMGFALVGYVVAAIRFRLREKDSDVLPLSTLPLLWATFFWFTAGLFWIHDAVPAVYEPAAVILFASGSALAVEFIGAALLWPGLRCVSALHPFMLVAGAVLQVLSSDHPVANYGWVAWGLALPALFFSIHRQRRDGVGVATDVQYVAAWLILAGVATWEAAWRLRDRQFLVCMGVALAGYVAAGLRFRLSEFATQRVRFSTAGLLWAMFFWFAAGFGWIDEVLPPGYGIRCALGLLALSALAYELASTSLQWPAMRWAARLPWLAIPVALVAELAYGKTSHPFADWAGFAWPLAWLLALYSLRREELGGERFATAPRHAIALYSVVFVLSWELLWRLADWNTGPPWRLAGMALPAILALLATSLATPGKHWPLRDHWPIYRDLLLPPLAAGIALWSLVANVRTPGSLQPLTLYVPFLNPVDLAIGAGALAVLTWARRLDAEAARSTVWKILAVLGFIWLNAIALRGIHYWTGVPYRLEDLIRSVLVQATLSILWTSGALALMVLSRRRMQRPLWVVGAVLLAAVVAKLFLIDLANTGTVARIVSFLGVGVMLLVIGYVAPVPPGIKEAEGRD